MLDIKSHNLEFSKCPECNNIIILSDHITGDTICSKCGLVLDEKLIDLGKEWRYFNKEHISRVRCGPPTAMYYSDKGLSTIIDKRNKDINGNRLKSKDGTKFYRLRKANYIAHSGTSKDKNLTVAMNELNTICSQFGFSENLRTKASILYRKGVDKDLLKGRSIELLIASVIFVICRTNGIHITHKQLLVDSHLKQRELFRGIKLIIDVFNISFKQILYTPENYVESFTSALNLSEKTKRDTYNILEKLGKSNLFSGRSHKGIAITVLYLIGLHNNEYRTQKRASEVSKITETTIRNNIKFFKKYFKIPSNFSKNSQVCK
nr:MAG: transcription initiation factor TFIIB [uncultured archaeon]